MDEPRQSVASATLEVRSPRVIEYPSGFPPTPWHDVERLGAHVALAMLFAIFWHVFQCVPLPSDRIRCVGYRSVGMDSRRPAPASALGMASASDECATYDTIRK